MTSATRTAILTLAGLAALGCGRNGLYDADSAGGAGAGAGGTTGAPRQATWILFDSLRSDNRDIYAVRPDGGALHQLTTSTAIDREPAVSPDGKTLVFSSDETGSFQLWAMALPSGTPRRLTSLAAGGRQPVFSPDGRRIAFSSGTTVQFMNADGTGVRQVADGMDTFGPAAHPAFTRDGGSLLYDRINWILRFELAPGRVTSIVGGLNSIVERPTPSPDGRTFAFGAQCDPGAVGQSLWQVPLATDKGIQCRVGERVTALADGPAHAPSFSSDGAIAFERGPTLTHLAVIRPGGAAVDVTSGGDDRNPTWSSVDLSLP